MMTIVSDRIGDDTIDYGYEDQRYLDEPFDWSGPWYESDYGEVGFSFGSITKAIGKVASAPIKGAVAAVKAPVNIVAAPFQGKPLLGTIMNQAKAIGSPIVQVLPKPVADLTRSVGTAFLAPMRIATSPLNIIDKGIASATGAVTNAVVAATKVAANGVAQGAKAVANVVADGAVYLADHDPMVNVVKGIASGKNIVDVMKDTVSNQAEILREVGPYAQIVVSMVPGVGQGVSAALGAGIALANGQSITDAAIAAARGAVPGGPLAQAAFDTAINIAKGKAVADSVLAATRDALPPAAQAAFDTGLALAKGQNIQTAIKAGAAGLLSGDAKTGYLIGMKLVSGGNVADTLLAGARSRLPPEGQSAFDAAVTLAKGGNVSKAALDAAVTAAKWQLISNSALKKQVAEFVEAAETKTAAGVAELASKLNVFSPAVAAATKTLKLADAGDAMAQSLIVAAGGTANPIMGNVLDSLRQAKSLADLADPRKLVEAALGGDGAAEKLMNAALSGATSAEDALRSAYSKVKSAYDSVTTFAMGEDELTRLYRSCRRALETVN